MKIAIFGGSKRMSTFENTVQLCTDDASFFYNVEYIHKMNQFEAKWNHHNSNNNNANIFRDDQVCFSKLD